MQIVPTLLCQTEDELRSRIGQWEGLVETVQIDFADGKFVPSTLPGPEVVNRLQTTLRIECHLMVESPGEYADELLHCSAVETVLVHVESNIDIPGLAQKIHAAQKLFGLAVRPETDLSKVEDHLGDIDQALILAVNPGFNGSPFLLSTMDKVSSLRALWPNGRIEVDGGMNPETIRLAAEAGASQAAVGSFLRDGYPATQLQELKSAVGEL